MTRTGDFRTMDLEVETHTSGIDEHGYPFYVWRESADNRYGLSRPRYCCITASGPELAFTFFNPSGDVKATAAWKAGAAVAAGFFVLFIVTMITDRYRDAPMPYSTDPPPGMVLIATFGSAMIFGGLVFYVWDCIATVLRWTRNRFADDGRVTQIPWAHLDSFSGGDARGSRRRARPRKARFWWAWVARNLRQREHGHSADGQCLEPPIDRGQAPRPDRLVHRQTRGRPGGLQEETANGRVANVWQR
ncbi:MAG: hypothetical protein IPL91_15075 [Hyphomicrobium sp.]|nr:hypothetical protein [Hyphomicrobium sp.]